MEADFREVINAVRCLVRSGCGRRRGFAS